MVTFMTKTLLATAALSLLMTMAASAEEKNAERIVRHTNAMRT